MTTTTATTLGYKITTYDEWDETVTAVKIEELTKGELWKLMRRVAQELHAQGVSDGELIDATYDIAGRLN